METTKANTTKVNAANNVLTVKTLKALKKDINTYKDSFASACRILLEVSNNGNADCKKVCQYLGINADSIKSKNMSDTRKNVLDKLPLYYMIEGSETHFPARLQKINKNAGIDAFIAVQDSYINALLSLAKILSEGNKYDIHKVELTSASVDCDSNEYTKDSVTFAAYDKNGSKVDADTNKYIDYLNRNKLANQVASEAKAAYLAK